MKKVRIDLVTGIILAVISAVYFGFSFKIRQVSLISITSAFIPRLCAVSVFSLSGVMVARCLMATGSVGEENDSEDAAQAQDENKAKMFAAVIAFITLGAGILLMEQVGFVAGMSVYLLFSFFSFSKYEKKNWALFVLLAVLPSVLIYLTFTRAFSLRLPQGILDIGGGIL